MTIADLEATAQAMVAPHKGILAADEDRRVLANRFQRIAVDVTDESARSYRQLLFDAPGIDAHLSAVILYDDTLRDHAGDGRGFPAVLSGRDIIPGINADGGPHPLAGHGDEFVTEGLDGLRERLNAWFDLGARFTKWRAAIRVGDGMPSRWFGGGDD